MVRVHDLDASLDFYCNKLGMEEVYRYESKEGRFTNIFLRAGGEDVGNAPDEKKQDKSVHIRPVLELTYNWPDENGKVEEYGSGRNFGHLAYAVDNIYETCQKLMDAGVTINRPPRDGRMAFIKSPDGISIELLQEGRALPLQEPWLSMENTGTW